MERFVKVCRQRRVIILALLHLFVVNAAGVCQRPQATETFVLSKEALLSNVFPEDVQVILECAHGYKRINGSGTTVCSSGQWSEPDLICEKKDCGPPKQELNLRFNITEGTQFRAIIRVFCDSGYKLIGSSFKRCYASGWVGNTKCKIVMCDKPGQVTNGRSSWSSEDRPKYGETIQYLCNEGYTLVGKEKIVCTQSGKYDFQPPECKDAAPPVLATSTSPPAEASAASVTVAATATAPTDSAPTDSTPMTSTVTVRSYLARGSDRPRNPQGGLHTPKTEGDGTTASVSPTTTLQDLNKEIINLDKRTGAIAVIFGFLSILLVLCAIGLCACKLLLRRKGSYDTREDLKSELSHFHNL